MFDTFVEIMRFAYNSELDISIYTEIPDCIEYRIYKPGSAFKEYISLFVHKSVQTKGLYADYITPSNTESRINLFKVVDTLDDWCYLFKEP